MNSNVITKYERELLFVISVVTAVQNAFLLTKRTCVVNLITWHGSSRQHHQKADSGNLRLKVLGTGFLLFLSLTHRLVDTNFL